MALSAQYNWDARFKTPSRFSANSTNSQNRCFFVMFCKLLSLLVMGTITRFEDIHALQKARDLVREVYKISNTDPFKKDFGLKDQIRSAALSAMSNIAEGYGRKSDRYFVHFLNIARASALEVQSILYVALDLEYVQKEEFSKLYNLANECISAIAGFSSYLRKS